MAIFNHTIARMDGAYLFECDDAFGQRLRLSLPYFDGFEIKVGGTASAGIILTFPGCIINPNTERGCLVITANQQQIECIPIQQFKIGDPVHIYEHLSYQPYNFGQFDFIASSKLPLYPNLHAVNIVYTNGSQELIWTIDPHTGFIREPNNG